jgi:hypothetical protein
MTHGHGRDGSIRLLAGSYKFQYVLTVYEAKARRFGQLIAEPIAREPKSAKRTKASPFGTDQLVISAIADEYCCRWFNSQPACRSQIDFRIGFGYTLGEREQGALKSVSQRAGRPLKDVFLEAITNDRKPDTAATQIGDERLDFFVYLSIRRRLFSNALLAYPSNSGRVHNAG